MQKKLIQSEIYKQQLSTSSMNSDNSNSYDNNNYVHFYNERSGSESGMGSANNDNDTLLQVQRRKLLRRAANRRSAQLSRARKKAHMEELKMDNRKLQRISDFLESIPDLVLCVDITGKITYISDNTVCSIKLSSSADNGNSSNDNVNSSNDNGSDDDPTHINQILTAESVTVLLETIIQLSKESDSGAQNGRKMKGVVREIYYHNANGFPVSGYMRCSKIITHPYEIENANESHSESAVEGPLLKKNRSRSPNGSRSNLSSLADVAIAAAAAESAAEDSKIMFISMRNKGSKDENDSPYPQKIQEDEFICVIRPTETMFENNDTLGTGLSKASMVAHDLGHPRKTDDRPRSPSGSTNSNGSFSAHNDNGSSTNHFRGSSGSSSSTSRGDKNSTSSETGSDDNGNT